jgi:hypothetical protein
MGMVDLEQFIYEEAPKPSLKSDEALVHRLMQRTTGPVASIVRHLENISRLPATDRGTVSANLNTMRETHLDHNQSPTLFSAVRNFMDRTVLPSSAWLRLAKRPS